MRDTGQKALPGSDGVHVTTQEPPRPRKFTVDPRTPRTHSIGIPYCSACSHSRLVVQNSECTIEIPCHSACSTLDEFLGRPMNFLGRGSSWVVTPACRGHWHAARPRGVASVRGIGSIAQSTDDEARAPRSAEQRHRSLPGRARGRIFTGWVWLGLEKGAVDGTGAGGRWRG